MTNYNQYYFWLNFGMVDFKLSIETYIKQPTDVMVQASVGGIYIW